MTRSAFAALLDAFAAGLGAGTIGAIIFIACFHPVHAAMVIRWIAG